MTSSNYTCISCAYICTRSSTEIFINHLTETRTNMLSFQISVLKQCRLGSESAASSSDATGRNDLFCSTGGSGAPWTEGAEGTTRSGN